MPTRPRRSPPDGRRSTLDVRRILRSGGPSGRGARIVAVLLALYIAELTAQALGLPVMELARHRMSGNLGTDVVAAWRNLTCVFVEWPGGGAVFWVLFMLVVTYSLWPVLDDALGLRRAVEAVACMAVAGLLLVNVVDALGAYAGLAIGRSYVLGWTPLWLGAICLYGLVAPGARLMLYFVLPVPMWLMVWGSLLMSLLGVIAAFGSGENLLPPMQSLGVWLGAYGWFHTRGPGGRRRYLLGQATKVERQLKRFRVLPGGGDETFH